MTTPAVIARLRAQVDELVARHERSANIADFARYADDPAGFFRDVLRCEPWSKQIEMAELVRDHRRAIVITSNGLGKDWITARIALWWIYARRGFVILTGPTERQVKAIGMRELRRAFTAAPELAGELYQLELRVDDDCGLIAFTSDNADRLVGFHHPQLLICATEGQGIPDETYEAMQACATAPENRIFVYGNPTRPAGAFFRAAQSDAWAALTVSSFEHPNVITGRQEIPGAVSREWIEMMRDEYGESSSIYQARVCARFPEDALEGLVQRAWLRAAFDRHEAHTLDHKRGAPYLALDVARFGPDASALAVVRGPVVQEIITWRGLSTTDSTDRVFEHAARVRHAVYLERLMQGDVPSSSRGSMPSVTVVVDDAGLGGGVTDQLRKRGGVLVEAFNGGAGSTQNARFLNMRAESHWKFRELLERGEVALPRSAELEEEASAVEWQQTPSGLIQMVSKELIRKAIGRSPDRLDSVIMGLFHSIGRLRLQWGTSEYFL